jgi:beta-lactamase superfamily II metal-dependent hydrolase
MALNYLKSKGVQKIDLMVATHPHSDHIGGLVAILKSMPVTKVVTNGQPSTTTTYENFLDAIASAKAEYAEAKRGDKLVVGNLVMDVLSPTTTEGDMNNNSLVIRFTEGSTTYLFMGDAQNEAEASILTAGLPVTADILKVGHHGSRTASSSAFLTAVKPAVAVYSAGIGNSYGHPHPETIAALFAVGAQIYGTDKNGTVVVTSNGQNYQVSTNGGPRAPPATPAPAIVATARPALSALTLDITNVSSPVSRGGLGEVDAITVPGATCKITVYYKSGPSTAKGLSPQTADENGNCSWSWTVASRTTPGTWRIVVMATLNGKSITKQTTFTVQ